MDVWSTVHAERAALVRDLERLDDEQWTVPSLCEGWSVHDVAAHLVDSARTTRVGFTVALVRAGLDFDRLNARGMERARGGTPRETLVSLRRVVSRTSTPPAPFDSRLVEEIVHGEDIRRPLGLTRDYPVEAVVRALRLQTRTRAAFVGAREVAARFRLVATDADVSIGDGPGVRGPALSLLMALMRGGVALGELTGPGVDALAAELRQRAAAGRGTPPR